MKQVKAYLVFVLVFVIGFLPAVPSQGQSKADSLLKALPAVKSDTQRIILLNNLAWALKNVNPDTSVLLSNEALNLAQHLSSSPISILAKAGLKGVAQSHKQIGAFMQMKGDYIPAMQHDSIALNLFRKRGDRKGESGVLNNMGIVYIQQGNYVKALEHYNAALKIAESQGNNLDIGMDLGNIGTVYMEQGEFAKGLDYFFRALKMDKEDGNTRGVAVNLGNIALAYDNLSNFSLAIDYAFKALKEDDIINDKIGYAMTLGNIGFMYGQQGDLNRSLEYYKKALQMDESLGNKSEISRMLINISEVYSRQHKFTEALVYQFKGLELNELLGNKHFIPYCMRAIGMVYENQADSALEKGNSVYAFKVKYPLALLYYNQSLDMALQTGDKPSVQISYGYIGSLNIKLKNFPEAEKFLSLSLSLADSTGDRNSQQIQHKTLSDLYEQEGKSNLALFHFKRYSEIKDSLFTTDKNKEITRKEMNYEFDKKESALKAEQDRKDIQNAAEKRRHMLAIYSGTAVLFLLLILALLIYRNNLQKQKANVMLGRKNEIIEKQKELVEEQNKNILDSINYAKRLQDAILPSELFSASEVKEHFVFFSPKDVVSGDFYWRYDTGPDLFFAVVDCTGHGVPGAMMSMLAYDILQAALKDMGLREPDEILQVVNDQIIEKLQKSNTGGTQDGMDLTLCRLNKASGILTYAGAKNELWVASGPDIQVYPVDKSSIGDKAGLRFTKHEVKLRENDLVYLFTDGYADQKGGPENKKYMRSKFRNLLSEIAALPCSQQQARLEAEFRSWKGDLRQRDDVLVVGFKVRTSSPS